MGVLSLHSVQKEKTGKVNKESAEFAQDHCVRFSGIKVTNTRVQPYGKIEFHFTL